MGSDFMTYVVGYKACMGMGHELAAHALDDDLFQFTLPRLQQGLITVSLLDRRDTVDTPLQKILAK